LRTLLGSKEGSHTNVLKLPIEMKSEKTGNVKFVTQANAVHRTAEDKQEMRHLTRT